MATWCLTKNLAETFKQKVEDGEIDPAELSGVSSDARQAYFESFLGKDNAERINTTFEEKIVLKNQRRGMNDWLDRNSGNIKPALKRDLVSKISKLDRILSQTEQDAFLKSLVAKKLGVTVSMEEANKIAELAKKATDIKDSGTSNLSGVSDEYLNAKNELKNYIDSIKPLTPVSSVLKNLAIIARNNLLFNPSTPIKTSINQIENTVMEGIARRFSNFASSSEVDSSVVDQAKFEAKNTVKTTGQNTASMESLDDSHILGKGENFKTPSGHLEIGKIEGGIETVVRKTAALSNKIVIDFAHSAPFIKFYQGTFFDAASFTSSALAKGEGLTGEELQTRATEIFKDAARIVPTTEEGAMVRHQAQEQAARVTSTNDTIASRFSIQTKNVFNSIIPGVNLGDIIMPIARIPATIVANGIDNAGAGLPKGVLDLFKGREKMQSDNLSTRYEGMTQYAAGIQRLMRIGGTVGTAVLFASQMKKEDFRTDNYGNNFVRIGNIWVNMEYISAVSPALAGAMLAKQKGTDFQSSLYEYGAGVAASLKKVPGIDEANSLISTGVKKYVSDFFSSRAVPVFLKNLLKDRPINRLFFGSTGVESQQDIQKAKLSSSENDWSTQPTLELQQFKDKIGDQKFKNAQTEFNQKMNDWFTKQSNNPVFTALSDKDQTTTITNAKENIKAAIFKEYSFKYKESKKPKNSVTKDLAK